MENFPKKIEVVIKELEAFCQFNQASLVLFGSRARQPAKLNSDWDLGIYFNDQECDRELKLKKAEWKEQVFPEQIDIVNLNRAPDWFLNSIREDTQLLYGPQPKSLKQVASL